MWMYFEQDYIKMFLDFFSGKYKHEDHNMIPLHLGMSQLPASTIWEPLEWRNPNSLVVYVPQEGGATALFLKQMLDA